ncbi:protein ros1 [Phtheirospermum japonicum]|uniref:Protein ros1 n=1 Tax=Phtheirospermum japonicum TaxID=374723 RepID=A0A830CYE6_9LAMI|nr:protein ros1 [Phtheirospermum japonicum]
MAASGEGAPPELKDFQIACSWIPATPAKPNSTTQQPICENWQINDVRRPNWVQPGRYAPFNPVTQANVCEIGKSPEDYNSTTQQPICENWRINDTSQPNCVEPGRYAPFNPVTEAPVDYVQTASACNNSPADLNNVSRRTNSNNWLLEENLSCFDTWQASQPANSRVYGDVLRTPDKFTIKEMSFQTLLALADARGNQAAIENELTDTSNFYPPVGCSQFTMSYGNSRPQGPVNLLGTFDAGLDIASILPGVSSSTPARPSFDLNSLPRTTTATTHAAFGRNTPFQFEPVTPQKPNKGESPTGKIAGDGVMELRQRNEKSHLVIDQSSTATSTQLQESHKPDKGGAVEEADLSKTPQLKARRKKHRPKVVIEGQKKRGPKPSAQKTPAPQDTTRVKRKYVRRKGVTINLSDSEINKEPTSPNTPKVQKTYSRRKGINKPEGDVDKETAKTNDVNAPPQRALRSCRRSLNFDSGSQVGDDEGSSQEEILTMEKNRDLTVCTRGKCQIVFSDVTHDKETPKSPGRSVWGSTCSNPERQVRGLKRQNTIVESEICNRSEAGTYYSFMQSYLPIFSQNADKSNGTSGFHFPAIYKKKRTEKGQNMVASTSDNRLKFDMHALRNSWTNQIATATNQGQCQLTNLLTTNPVIDGIQNGRKIFEDLLALGPTERIRKKRSKSPNRVRDLASLQEIGRQMPASTSRAAATSRVKQNIAFLHEPPTCMEALVADTRTTMSTKKRSKRNILTNSTVQNLYDRQKSANKQMGPPPPLALTWRNTSPVDSIVEQLNRLDINASNQASAEKQNALLASHQTRYLEQHTLVPYQRSGAVVPFDRSFDQVKKRRPRPKVDLDDETTKVWKLLLENINSEGIDGTDEEKTKWWEEERRVFNGRADSFIARMHLVQGDRRFSPWKGSVVDSVVGVFLTQNVSDHLSSSAFMSVAARFPLKPKTEPAELHEENLATDDVCCLDPHETFRLNDNILSQSVCGGGDTKTGLDFEGDNICDGLNLKDKSGGQSPDTSKQGPVTSDTNNSVILIEDGRDAEDALSSQISSQNSSNSPVAQTTDSCLPSTTSEEEPTANTFNSSTSFVKLLQMAGTVLHGVYEGNGKTNSSENMALDLQSEVHMDNPIFPAETIAPSELSSESASGTTFQKITDVSSVAEPKFSSTNATTSSNNDQGEINQKGQVPAQSLLDITGSSSNVEVNSSKNNPKNHRGKTVDGAKAKAGRPKKDKENQVDWDQLRKKTLIGDTERAKTANAMDSVDWDAVRCADVNEIAQTIKERGMNNMLAERIKDFLNRLVRDHGSIDLEWLRDVPPDKAKEYLLSIRGLGLKSVECVRLLTLHHLAFPVDTNVGRIAVRLGWVPLQPLPESLQLHLLELYPVLESIQKYLWPRLCKLDQPTLYELHYQMITFGKVFCTKSKPNCNACPMRGECRHFASAFASARLSLPAPEEKSIVSATGNRTENRAAADQHPTRSMNDTLLLPSPEADQHPTRSMNDTLLLPTRSMNDTLLLPSPEANQLSAKSEVSSSQPIIEEPLSPEPIVEMPSTPEQVYSEVSQCDIENAFNEDPDEIPTIQLNMEEFTHNLQKIMQQNSELQEGSNMSKALVALTSEAASIPVPKLKNISRLRTEHQVYELPDSHPLLQGMEKREPDDPCPYLLAIWTPGETVDSIEPPERQCNSQGLDKLCTDATCLSCNSVREANSQTVRGTILIPCRTAMRGSFPLNGTYFQVNEVFSDHESSTCPLDVPRQWLWNLPRRTVYFGTSIPTIFKGLTTEGIQYCFWRGFVCVRGFDRTTRGPRPLIARLHFPASRLAKGKGKMEEN